MPKRGKADPKLESLTKTHTQNPHPEKVQDELFKSNEFFDPRDLMQVKYEMLRRVEEDGWSISRASSTFGFSRPSFYEAKSDFDHSGLAGFIPERRGPRAPHKLSGEVIQFIENIKLQEKITTPELINRIKERFGLDVHRRTIERAVSKAKKKP
jgi:transposase